MPDETPKSLVSSLAHCETQWRPVCSRCWQTTGADDQYGRVGGGAGLLVRDASSLTAGPSRPRRAGMDVLLCREEREHRGHCRSGSVSSRPDVVGVFGQTDVSHSDSECLAKQPPVELAGYLVTSLPP
jgi:hypothetical protein